MLTGFVLAKDVFFFQAGMEIMKVSMHIYETQNLVHSVISSATFFTAVSLKSNGMLG